MPARTAETEHGAPQSADARRHLAFPAWHRRSSSSRSGSASYGSRTRTRSSTRCGERRSSTTSATTSVVADGIVRALYERPTQLKRHPDGAEGEAIYQKRVPKQRPEWIETARVTFPSGRHADELCVTEVAQVAWAANLGTIDFHPWPSRRADVEHPDELRIDVDPQPGTTFADGKRVAARRARGAGGDRLQGLAEDVGQPRHPHRLPDRAPVDVSRGPPLRAVVRPRGGAAAARARDHGLVEGGARRPRLHRLQPERPRPHDRLGVLGARAAGRDGVGARYLGRASGRGDGGLHDPDDARALRAARRRPERDRRGRVRPPCPARVGRAGRERRPRRGALPAPLPEDAGRAPARAALSRADGGGHS